MFDFMPKLIVQNPYNSVKEIALTHRLLLPKPREWRLMAKALSGEINGIHTIRGIAVATNGIHVAILRDNDIVIGHLEWFVADEQSPSTAPRATRSGMPRQNIFEGFSFE